MEYENLHVKRDGHIAVVTLNRPEISNALNQSIMTDIERVTEEFQEDVETRVVIFTGEGKHFSSGADLSGRSPAAPVDSVLAMQRRISLGPRMIRKLHEMNQITIAAVNGAALGGGACITTALDFRIGAEDCEVGYPEATLGMSLSWFGLPMCTRIVGPSRAKRMIILANKEKAQTLYDWGFLDELAAPDSLMDKAMEIAGQYAAMPPIPAQMIKKSVNAVTSAMDQAIMHMDPDQLMLTHRTEDFVEAMGAYHGKRTGTFTGK